MITNFINSIFKKKVDDVQPQADIFYEDLRDLTIEINNYEKYENYTDEDFEHYIESKVDNDLMDLVDILSDDATYANDTPEEIYNSLTDERERHTLYHQRRVDGIKYLIDVLPQLRSNQQRLTRMLAEELNLPSNLSTSEVLDEAMKIL